MSSVVVTGATGFIGLPCVRALRARGHEVHAIARRAGEAQAGVTWHEADLLATPEIVGELGADSLIHLAWYTEHRLFWDAPDNVLWVEGSLAMLRAFAAGRGRRAVLAGTCAEYAWDRDVYPESAETRPTTLYGASKHGLHTVAQAYAEQAGLSLAWGRLFFLYGPREAPERLVASLVRSLLARQPARMTDGTQRRDFLHVEDAADALAMLASSDLTGAVNVASGDAVELRALGALIAAQVGAPELLEVGTIRRRDDDPPSVVADATLLAQTGWRPRIALDDGVYDTLSFWRGREATGQLARFYDDAKR